MPVLRNGDPALRAYFQKYAIPDIYEALLGGLLIMCPEDPLRFLEEKIKEMMEKGLYGIIWNMCIDPELSLKLRVLSETYLHTLLGLDDDQLMTTELCDRAWDFYSTNLKRKCFDTWIQYCEDKKAAEEQLQKKLATARHYYDCRLLKLAMRTWYEWVNTRKELHKRATQQIEKIFNKALKKVVFKSWRKYNTLSKKPKKSVEPVLESEELLFVQPEREVRERRHSERRRSSVIPKHVLEELPTFHMKSGREYVTKVPMQPLAQVFRYLNIVDLARCAQVCQTWKAMTQVVSIWSSIDFSEVKDVINDSVAQHILRKWHTNVVQLSLHGCATLHWLAFKCIGGCVNLQELNVSKYQGLNDKLIRFVAEGCSALLHLDLSHTDISNGTLALLPRCFPNLQFLSIAYCRKFTDKGLHYLGNGRGCHKLLYLDISGCLQITVEGFRNLGNSCSRIRYLTINEMPTFTDRCIQALVPKCQWIESVECNESPHLSDIGLKAFNTCQLVKMKIQGSNLVTDLSFKVISKFWPRMNHICVTNCKKITDVAVKLIAPLDNIVILNLSGCPRISDSGIKSFVDGPSASKLKELNLANCSYVSDIALVKISERCPNLIYLNLQNCKLVTDTGVQAMTAMASLAYLNISRTGISDQGLESLGRHFKIKEIILSECRLISDTGMKALCTELKKLDYLDLSFCRHISNSTLKYLSLNCRKLTCLILVGCFKINDAGIQLIASGCNFLHYLDISGCKNVTDRALKNLAKGCLQLRILKMLYCIGITRPAVSSYAPRLQKYEYNDDEPPLWFGTEVSGDELIMAKKLKKRRYSTMAMARPSILGSLGEKDLEQTKLPLIEAITEQAVEESLISPGSLAEDP
ncbi:dynein regulatory complex subunit 6 [Pseudonaja textilis]|uniref:dynein regulatory complex subunit 6 n=1 Tax=Pseudonaja textilis TaxID=8673 RepID=UPI000EAA023B|nr:dynein regulatory complex subunit 6 [Pseudonaja textilis]